MVDEHSVCLKTKTRKGNTMKKNLALLLAVALAFTCMLGFGATAEESASDVLVTVPMRATVSILYAVKAADSEGVSVLITRKDNVELDAPEAATRLDGTYEIGGVEYILFEYSNLAASEMRTSVTATIGEKTVTYSVAQFVADYTAQYAENAEYAKQVTLVEKMLAYGDAVAAMN